ncbi:MAG: 4-hydroxy-3-methylbut-2-enyl diphosphate reductase [Bacteroidota bacterium]|jgi:4-hydroxy-3-methylbut-2-enyl diphosphate reductase|nr:4-hydroxy-3-methylbut-2-enyl diphosphate reductase [Sphingobacteriales bacterium]
MNVAVDIDDNSGFCFGVVYAIQMAEDILDETGRLYCLGDIVHNDEEVARLRAKGLKIINHDEFDKLRNETVLIRAHGEPPETYQKALANNIELIDASCPVVLKLQNRVREAYNDKEQILIYGKHGHAEVDGLKGQTNGEAIVIEKFEELDQIELPKKVQLFSQTTKRTKNLYALKDLLISKGVEVDFNDTLCRQVSNRDIQLREFATKYDKIVFVAGKKSSNGKVLFDVCKDINPQTYFVSSKEELDKSWFNENDRIGICGATSTPQWQMEEIKQSILSL